MIYFYLFILLAFNACWLTLVLFYLPGNWLMVVATCFFAWVFREHNLFGPAVLIAIAVLALAGELVELLAGPASAKRAGAGWPAALAALAGTFIGALLGNAFLPVIGTLIGAALGAGITVWIVERLAGRSNRLSLQTGAGAGLGVVFGTIAKFVIGCIIWLVIAVAAFWP